MLDVLTIFDSIAAGLAAHPRIHLTCAWLGQPAPVRLIRETERRLGARLPPPITRLYQACNGLQLRWRLGAPDAPPEPALPCDRIGLIDDDACINLVTLEALAPFVPFAGPPDDQAAESSIIIGGREWSEAALLAALVPLNRYSDHAFGGLLRGRRRFAPMVVPVASFGQRILRPRDGGVYLQQLFACAGLFGLQTGEQPWPDDLPVRWSGAESLDRLVALAQADQ